MKHVMIDLESLAVTADAAIISIGAVEFELDGQLGEKFYSSVSIDSNLGLGRRIEEETLLWWMGQSEEARKVFSEPKIPLQGALFDLATWFPKNQDRGGNNSTCVWSNGASFDIPMLELAFKQAAIEVPWAFWNSRCVRTYRALPGAERVSRPVPSVAHNALDDAIAQAKYVQDIHKAVFGNAEVTA